MTTHGMGQDLEIVKFDQLQQYIQKKDSKVKVINFWATWCKPCVEELPYFEQAHQKHQQNGIEVLLVSFDFPSQLETRVKPFLAKHNVQSPVVLLDETDFNSFIDKVDPTWSGAIPATLIVDGNNGTRQFFEKQFKEGELEQMIQQYVN